MAKIEGLFFEYVYARKDPVIFSVSRDSCICGEEGYPAVYLRRILDEQQDTGRRMTVTLSLEIPERIREEVGACGSESGERYAVEILETEIFLYAVTKRGLLYAVATLKHLLEADRLSQLLIYDYPDKSVRGYRVYIPGEKQFDAFRDVLDMLVEYKYNAIIIEVGGAMEYKRHPEINAKWVAFCTEVHRSPYEAHRIQKLTHPQWQKNSIHADNGDGGFITQRQMRRLLEWCRERELEVIPEVPSLSHSDYLVMAHPEIREREADTYPDTYCPSNPKSYDLLFDILDEVIDVFQPKQINIGHDECYTLGKCPLCTGKDPADLYVGDIQKIRAYLKARGIRLLMWAEKFFDNVYLPDENGVLRGYGGTGEPAWDVPRVIGCVGKIPTDITLLHWYWSICDLGQEREVCGLGYPMVFGNLQGLAVREYRSRAPMFAGGFVSNWGSFEPEYMQRNAQNFNLLSSAWVFWSNRYDTPMSREVLGKVKQALHSRYLKTLGGNPIRILHTTDYARPYKAFYDGYYIVSEEWTLGHHIVTYTDGVQTRLPVVYGYNIRSASEKEVLESGSEEAVATSYIESIGASCPVFRDGKMYYSTAYRNPFPEKQIASISFAGKDGICVEVMQSPIDK